MIRKSKARGIAMRLLIGLTAACAMLSGSASNAIAQPARQFHLQEATGSIHAAFTAGQLTCTQLTRLYPDRIEAYDRRGPALHAIAW